MDLKIIKDLMDLNKRFNDKFYSLSISLFRESGRTLLSHARF